MARLTPDEQALWAKVAATVTPLGAPRGNRVQPRPISHAVPAVVAPDRPRRVQTPQAETLDSGWDRRLSRGQVAPDMVIDLHGLSRDQARQLLYRRLHAAQLQAVRVVLVITGKGGGSASGRLAPADLVPGLSGGASPRGSIRADLPRWLGEGELSSRIAAVRNAHPRHGGGGAVYLILRRSGRSG